MFAGGVCGGGDEVFEAGVGDVEAGDRADDEDGRCVDRRSGKVGEDGADDLLVGHGGRLDYGDGGVGIEAAEQESFGDEVRPRGAHKHDERGAEPCCGLPVDAACVGGVLVAGDDGEAAGVAPHGDGDAGGGGPGDGRRDAGDDLDADRLPDGLAAGDPVDAWIDKTGNGYDFTGKRGDPSYSLQNGRGVVYFDGNDGLWSVKSLYGEVPLSLIHI